MPKSLAYPHLHRSRNRMPWRATPALVLLMCAALAGCAAPAGWRKPVDGRTAQTLASARVSPGFDEAATALPHLGSVAELARWWQRTGDAALPGLIERAQAASPTLAQATTRIVEARAARTQAQAALGPTLDGSAALQRGNTQGGVSVPVTTTQLSLQAGWEIDLFGANAAQAQAAAARLAMAQAGWHQARVSLAAEVALQRVALAECEKQLAVVRADSDSRAASLRLNEISANAGLAAPATTALARASAAEGRARVAAQAAQCVREERALATLVDLPVADVRQRLAAAPYPWGQDAAVPLPAVPAQLLQQRPDVFMAAQTLAAASADWHTADMQQRYPRLALQGSIAVGSVRLGGNTQDARTWSIGPLALTLPILDGGRRAANTQVQIARYEEAASAYRASARQAVREVEDALTALRSTSERADDARLAAEGYRASFAAAEARQRAGLGSLPELEDARRVLLAAESTLLGLQRERASAWVALYRAVGGGWEESTNKTAANALNISESR
jgi:outer membrane protein, multidrug efflux system